MLEEQLRGVVDEGASQGWELVNEGTEVKKKIGWVRRALGTHLSTTVVVRKFGVKVLWCQGALLW